MKNFILSYENDVKVLFFPEILKAFDISNFVSQKDILEFIDYISRGKKVNEIEAFDKIIDNHYYGNSICIIPSNECQMKCKYCYSQSGQLNGASYINLDFAKKIINILFENGKLYAHFGKKDINILFHGGGEPTMNWRLFQSIVDYIYEKNTEYNYTLNLRIVTNGMFTTQKALWIANRFKEVVFSIDGPPFINDNIRLLKNNKKITGIAINNAKVVSKITNVGIHSVVTGLSIGNAEKIVEYFSKEVDNLKFINFEKFKQTKNGRNEVLGISNKDYLDFLLASYKFNSNIVKSSILNINPIKSFCKANSGSMIYCFPNNNITLCNEHDDMYIVGSYYNGNININSSNYYNYKELLKKNCCKLKCEDCYVQPFCKGGCLSYCEQCENYTEEWCELYKKLVKQFVLEKISSQQRDILTYRGIKINSFQL